MVWLVIKLSFFFSIFFQRLFYQPFSAVINSLFRLFGKTEHVFKPKTDLFEESPQPPKRTLRDMIGGSTAVASIEQPPDTMFQQIKRPLDMNSLEKGPPAAKVQRMGLKQIHEAPIGRIRDRVMCECVYVFVKRQKTCVYFMQKWMAHFTVISQLHGALAHTRCCL